MYPNKQKDRFFRGSVLIVALVICAVATFGVLATVSIIGARSHQSEAELAGLDRRLKFRNSKALAKEAIYRNYLPEETTLSSAKEYVLSGGWGKAEIGTFDEAPFIYSDSVRIHPTGASSYRAFSTDVEVKLDDGGFYHTTQFQLRSYNPILGGDLLSIHPTVETAAENVQVIGDLNVNGRAVFWEGNYSSNTLGVQAEEMTVPLTNGPNVSFQNPGNGNIKPSNYPDYGLTAGKVAGGNHYLGRLDIVNNSISGANSYFQRIERIGGYADASGTAGGTDALGPDTAPASSEDPQLIAKIEDTNLSESELVGDLAANSPLSSAVITALLQRTPPVSDSYLIPLLNAQAPLPDDVMMILGDHNSTMSKATRDTLLLNTGYSYLSDGKGGVIINLQSIYLPNIRLTDVTYLTLVGQADTDTADQAKLLDPRVFAIQNPDNLHLTNVILEGITNQRRMVLAISQTGVLDSADLVDTFGNPSTTGNNYTEFHFMSGTPFVSWRGIFETQGVSSLWNIYDVSTATVVGGIRTDHSIRITGGTLSLDAEAEPEVLESLLSRNAWIESYKQ